jgi:hypothetical protein
MRYWASGGPYSSPRVALRLSLGRLHTLSHGHTLLQVQRGDKVGVYERTLEAMQSPFSLSSISAMVDIATRRCDMCGVCGPTEVIHGTNLCIDFDHPLNYQLVDGEHDVFGDGKVMLIPTYGHTPGHQSLLVRASKDTQMVFTADACYTKENLDRDVLPRVLWDAATMSHSLATLRHLRDRQGATLCYGHDPDQWRAMRRVPAPLVEA